MSVPSESQPLPHAVGPEKSVLSSMFQEPTEYIQRAVEMGITPAHFYLPAHSTLCEILLDRHSRGIEVELVSFTQSLLDKGLLDRVGGPATLTDLYTYAATHGQFQSHVGILKGKFLQRKIIEICNSAIEGVRSDPELIIEHLESLEGRLRDLPRAQGKGFTLTHANEVGDEIEDSTDFVEGLFTDGGASVVYGPSNCGKTFWILDVCVHVAAGRNWRCDEHEVDQGAVVYFALEGSRGTRTRIKALRKRGKLPQDAPLFVVWEHASLLESGHSERIAATVREASEKAGMPVKLVVFDTLARAMAGGDENSGQDMSAAVKTIDAVRQATGAHVCVIHHCGKDEARGARGHSSLRAAVDTEIEIFRPEGETVSTVRVTKQRDLQIGEPMPFSLEVVELGNDQRGRPVSSCVLRHEDEMMAAKPKKAGRKSLCTPEEMLRFLPAASVKDWQERVEEETGLKSSQFYDHKRALEQSGKVTKDLNKRIVAA